MNGATQSSEHAELVRAILATYGHDPRARLFANSVPVAIPGRDGRPRFVTKSIIVGSTDIVGVLAPWGRWIGLECKTGGATTTRFQRLHAVYMRGVGAWIETVRSVAEAGEAIERARRDAEATWARR